MNTEAMFAAAAGELLRTAVVLRVESDGSVVVRPAGRGELVCDVLHTGSLSGLLLAPDDTVLYWQPDADAPRGVILGRVGPSHAPAGAPEELLLEARQSLTLRVGQGSIQLRADGKVLIKGRDLVSHAQRMNRIKGGAVAIN